MDKPCREAMSWALNGNHIRVYPKPYMKATYQSKGRKKTTLYKCKLIIEIGNAKHEGKEIYRQDEISVKVCEIYQHYYKQRKK